MEQLQNYMNTPKKKKTPPYIRAPVMFANGGEVGVLMQKK